jgi:sugar/nucleoside kinase (ribokinase family)
LQADLIRQLDGPKLIVADTRDLWINTERKALIETLGKVTGAILNDAEARLLAGDTNLVLAGRKMLEWGPEFVVIKKGEHGAMLVTAQHVAALPAYPTTEVKDPTGAGDAFAGGMMGYLASEKELDIDTLQNALARGTITASFTIEDFSLRRIEKVTMTDIDKRLDEFAAMLRLG